MTLLRRSRAAGGLPARRKLERGPKRTKRPYVLRGRVRCGHCQRRMEGTPRQERIYYRCAARGIVPGSPALEGHPKNIYLPERAVIRLVNAWLGELFDPANRDATVDRLLGAAAKQRGPMGRREQVQHRVDKTETELRRLQDAIKAGANPAALVGAINQAHEQYEAALAELHALPADHTIDRAEIYARLDSLEDQIGSAFNDGDPAQLDALYEELRLEMIYHAKQRTVDVTIRPDGRDSERVRGRSCTLTTRISLSGRHADR
ncbi:MAG TPA: recombinase zinc beta ribbon domain-containing protein [Actinophytocola sp.]|uniref:zinc ribbon domain-containing protein n=1 Tax=Actinophytocola sp. TaxID=1872138 RepID=UPI002DB88BFA|nr:recombinase zinc beta ribbon domain-containing protein [Actinophytocola sp.]HEU5474326.1 recombinase zinc beta ribbon domain-containing protein [Actinophytocola sp.]